MHANFTFSNISQKRLYTLELVGRLDEEFINAYCPADTVLIQKKDSSILMNINTDQSGLIGLIRVLHNLGFILLALTTSGEIPVPSPKGN